MATPIPMPCIMAPGGGSDGPRLTMTSSGGGRRFGVEVSTRLIRGVSTCLIGGISTRLIGVSLFFFDGSVGVMVHGQVGPSATLVGRTAGVSAALAPSE